MSVVDLRIRKFCELVYEVFDVVVSESACEGEDGFLSRAMHLLEEPQDDSAWVDLLAEYEIEDFEEDDLFSFQEQLEQL